MYVCCEVLWYFGWFDEDFVVLLVLGCVVVDEYVFGVVSWILFVYVDLFVFDDDFGFDWV